MSQATDTAAIEMRLIEDELERLKPWSGQDMPRVVAMINRRRELVANTEDEGDRFAVDERDDRFGMGAEDEGR